MRSLLTVLGIFIGIASVVWLLAIGEGISQRVQLQIEALGTNNIILRSVQPLDDEVNDDSMAIYGITRDDYEALSDIPTINKTLRIRDARRELYYGGMEISVHLIGCTPEYDDVMKLELRTRDGDARFINDLDIENAENVCVLSGQLAKRLFVMEQPLGKIIRIRDIPYLSLIHI